MPQTHRKDVTNEEIGEFMRPAVDRMMKFVVLDDDARAASKRPSARSRPAKPRNGHSDRPPKKEPQLPPDLTEFLVSVLERPNEPNSRRYEWLGISADRGNRAKNSLIDRGLIEQININLGKSTGGRVSMLVLTGNGYSAIGKIPPAPRKHVCGAEHWWWQQNIYRESCAKGYETHIEHSLDGKHRADVAFRKDNTWHAIEATISMNNVLDNVRGDLGSGFDKVFVACRDAKQKAAVEQHLRRLTDQDWAKTQIMLLSDFAFVRRIISKKPD